MDSNTHEDTQVSLGSVEDVENLVLALYQPGPPQEIARIQETLQRLQRSADGWQLARSLLERDDEKVKFFGALTFTVKLNSDAEALDAADATAVLECLINSLIRFLNQGVGALVVRKLCSTLVVFFLRFSSLWPTCVGHLVQSLYIGVAVPLQAAEQTMDIGVMVSTLSVEKARAALWFSSTLADEVGKTDANHIKLHKLHNLLQLSAGDAVCLMSVCLGSAERANLPHAELRQEAMRCFQSWVLYSHRAFVDSGATLEPLKTLTKPAITAIVEEDMYGVCVELFADVLANYSRFLGEEDFQLLFGLLNSAWSVERYNRLVQGDYDFDSLQYGQLMLAFGDAKVQDLARNTDPKAQHFLTALIGLLAAKGFAIAEDKIFVQALEFWATFVEVMIDALYSEDEPEVALTTTEHAGKTPQGWFATARDLIMQAIESCWRKIQFPPPEVFDHWDSADRIGFADARKDVADLLQSSYTLTGAPLFSLFASMVTQSSAAAAWPELEASLFCLGALAECVNGTNCDTFLAEVFGSPLFEILASEEISVPLRCRQTALSLIGQFSHYFERHGASLPSALTFLFKAIRFPVLAGTASRAIYPLCSCCRQSLTLEAESFIEHYGEFAVNPEADALAKERIVGAIGSIIQAMPLGETKTNALTHLIGFVEQDFVKSLRLAEAGEIEAAESASLEALGCLQSLARGLQVPGDVPIDLDDAPVSSTTLEYWQSGDGSSIQAIVRTIIDGAIATFPHSGGVLEAACSIYRAGFTERVPGPFVFPTGSVCDFLLRWTSITPRLSAVIGTACAFVSSQASSPSRQRDIAVTKLLTWMLGILEQIKVPANDPEIAHSVIDFFYHLLPNYVGILMEQPRQLTDMLLMFTLRAFTGADPLPKSSAADFWTQFVVLADLPQHKHSTISETIEAYGPFLAEALAYNIGGNASRSELDKISEPLKKLVSKHVHSKAWLEQALFKPGLCSDKVTDAEKKRFLLKIITLRGAKQTNAMVRDFWLACRGSAFAYAS